MKFVSMQVRSTKAKATKGMSLGLSAALLLAAGVTALAACASAAGSPPSTGRTAVHERGTEVVKALGAGKPVTLAPGEGARIDGGMAIVRFVRVVEDSRCPRGATCVWAGRARVEVSMKVSPSGPERVVELEVGDATKGQLTVTGVKLLADQLTPLPRADVRTADDEYRLRIAVPPAR